jgi:phytoene dehydrogenase-like protein
VSPVPALYLCGAGTHPGGGVTGAPGHNAARRILGDLKRDRALRRGLTA